MKTPWRANSASEATLVAQADGKFCADYREEKYSYER